MGEDTLGKFRKSWIREINDQNTKSSANFGDKKTRQQEIEDDDLLSKNCLNLRKRENRPRDDIKLKKANSDCKSCLERLEKRYKPNDFEPRTPINDEQTDTKQRIDELGQGQGQSVIISSINRTNGKSSTTDGITRCKIGGHQEIQKLKCNTDASIRNESFLDILIADIDEIVSLPFFDLELPRELAIRIFSFLSLKDLINCALVNKQWKILAEDDLLWYEVCIKCGFDPRASCALDREGWKNIVKECFMNEIEFKKNWKERICQISELEYERGGILYAASIFDDKTIAGYANGLIKVWNISTETPVASLGTLLAESGANGLLEKSIECVGINEFLCTGGYSNGDVSVWQNGHDFPIIHTYQSEGRIDCLNVGFKTASVISSSGCKFRIDVANNNGTWGNPYLAQAQKNINSVNLYDSGGIKAIITTTVNIEVHDTLGRVDELEKVICSEVSCTHCTEEFLYVGITPLHYSVLDGYRIKMYDIVSGNLSRLLKGPHCKLSCLHAADGVSSTLAVGCSDKKIRIHDENVEDAVMSLNGATGIPCSLQVDDWKVIAGDESGLVSVWDQRSRAILWQTKTRHPVRICKLRGPCLVTASTPLDKNPRETLWYADDLIQHRRHRGNIRIYNFSVDNSTTGVPDICQSGYDSFSGYNYNINLVTPYDRI